MDSMELIRTLSFVIDYTLNMIIYDFERGTVIGTWASIANEYRILKLCL